MEMRHSGIFIFRSGSFQRVGSRGEESGCCPAELLPLMMSALYISGGSILLLFQGAARERGYAGAHVINTMKAKDHLFFICSGQLLFKCSQQGTRVLK